MATTTEEFRSTAEETSDSPIEEVRLTVPTTDDCNTPVLTFRTWVLGLGFCVLVATIDQIFSFRQNPIYISATICQILALPLGKLMAKALPTREIKVAATRWAFSLNPGPFNMKEHVMISMLVTAGTSTPMALAIVIDMKVFFHRYLDPLTAILLVLSSQFLGYGLAGMFMNVFVRSPSMWWSTVLPDVSFYRTLHEKERRRKGHISRMQFFVIVSVISFAYYIVPSYYFPSITALSFVCWIWKDSVTAQQIGSGVKGFGLGSLALDWVAISGYLPSPMIMPFHYVLNTLAGFVLSVYILTPLGYMFNLYNAKSFPIFSFNIFDSKGEGYDFSRAMDAKTLTFDEQGYESYSKPHMSIFQVLSIGMTLASVASGLSQFVLFYGWSLLRIMRRPHHGGAGDVHNRLMEKYDPIPKWWFLSLLATTIGSSLLVSEVLGRQLQLPYWMLLLAIIIAIIILVPSTMVMALSGLSLSVGTIPGLIITYMYSGRPLGIGTFQTYAFNGYMQAMGFLGSFKLGHYMKIPPRSMFCVQIVGMLVSCMVNLGVTWWLFASIDNLCHPDLLPKGSPWTCTAMNVGFSGTVLWDIIGPRRVFFPDGEYGAVFVFFIVGLLAPVFTWILSRTFPSQKWIELVDFAIIFIGGNVFPNRVANYWSWGIVSVLYNMIVYRRFKGWWSRYNYILSYGLDVGVALMALMTLLIFNLRGLYGPRWWGLEQDDHCPLASCPTAPGIKVDGCPVY